jgi:hypothetical protein
MVATNFWTNPGQDPKRNYRFLVDIATGLEGEEVYGSNATWYASKADKPKFSVTETPHKFINHTFHYPGRVEWETLTITLVDPVDPNAAAATAKLLERSGYLIPANAAAAAQPTTINKSDAIKAMGTVTITQIGENSQGGTSPTGPRAVEKWVLRNAWIQAANFSMLDYESDELSTIELTLRYDWAELTVENQTGPNDTFFVPSGEIDQ